MTTRFPLAVFTGLALVAAVSSAQSPPPSRSIELKVTKYDQLTEAIKAHQGKIIVLDIWSVYCLPCKKEFPHLVQMHEQLGKEGVVCISVTIDEKEHEAAVLKYLQAQKAAFPNYLLDEEPGVWQEKFKVTAPPATLVYDREGKLVQRFANESRDDTFTYQDVEKLVKKLLAK